MDKETLCTNTSATGRAFGDAAVFSARRAAARGTSSPVMASVGEYQRRSTTLCALVCCLLEECELAPQRYTLLTDALSSDDESCSEWQAMKAELSDWNISTKYKSSKKRKKRRRKKKPAQTASCPDQFEEEGVKLDPKQGCIQDTLWARRVHSIVSTTVQQEPIPTVHRDRTISAGTGKYCIHGAYFTCG